MPKLTLININLKSTYFKYKNNLTICTKQTNFDNTLIFMFLSYKNCFKERFLLISFRIGKKKVKQD